MTPRSLVRWTDICWLICCMFILSSTATAKEIKFESAVESVAVIELFTSHGCSSCPPADMWIRKFSEHQGLWNKVIPMAFHVDYWDYLGWKDHFARSRYSQRQKQYQKSGGIRSVYTPGFVVNGREWRGWLRGGLPDISPGKRVGCLSILVTMDQQVIAHFNPVAADVDAPQLKAHMVLLGFDINSKIGGGENSGREFKEDFVVLGDSIAKTSSVSKWIIPWPDVRESGASRFAVVVWLSAEGNPAPIQAVAGWLNQ